MSTWEKSGQTCVMRAFAHPYALYCGRKLKRGCANLLTYSEYAKRVGSEVLSALYCLYKGVDARLRISAWRDHRQIKNDFCKFSNVTGWVSWVLALCRQLETRVKESSWRISTRMRRCMHLYAYTVLFWAHDLICMKWDCTAEYDGVDNALWHTSSTILYARDLLDSSLLETACVCAPF